MTANAQPDLLAMLRDLEVALHQPEVRRDPARLDELLHDGFSEIGRSGRIYDKAGMLRELPKATTSRTVWSQEFKVALIAEGVALLTYRSAAVDEHGTLSRPALRSSLWQRTHDGWQLRFHQGTPTSAFIRRK